MADADKRSVTTDALETLGTFIGEGEKRDAIHLAVEPVVAAEPLRPGDHVGFVREGVGYCDKPLGIVDPFLTAPVEKGQRFWLVVYPRQIRSLRHVWEHPAFPASQTEARHPSEKWLRDYAASLPQTEPYNDRSFSQVTYEQLLCHAKEFLERGDYWSEGGRFEGSYIPEEFWDHYENVTGQKVRDEQRASFFSCAC